MGVRVLPDGTVEAEGVSGMGPVAFTPEQAEFFGWAPPEGADPLVPPAPEPFEPEWLDPYPAEAGEPLSIQPDAPPAEAPGLVPVDPYAPPPGEPTAPQPGALLDPYADAGAPGPQAAPQAAPPPLSLTGNAQADALLERAYGDRADARALEAEAVEDQAKLGQLAEGERIKLEEQRQGLLAEEAGEVKTAYETASAQAGELRDEARELSLKEPDPGRWWSSRSASQKAASYVGAIIQGYLRPGAPNTFVAALMREVDKDVALQGAQIERQLDVLQEEQRQVGIELDRDIERMKATFGARQLHIESALRSIDAVERAGQKSMATTKARSALLRQQAEDEAALANTIVTRERESEEAVGRRRERNARIRQINAGIKNQEERLKLEREKLAAADAAAQRKATAEAAAGPERNELGQQAGENTVDQLYTKDGKEVWRNTRRKGTAAKIEETMAGANEASGIIAAMLEEGPEGRIWNLLNDDKNFAEGLRKQLVTAMRRALAGPGVTSDKDMVLIHEIIPLPGEVVTKQSPEVRRAKLQALLLRTEAGVNAWLAPAGIKDVEFRANQQGKEGLVATWRSLRGDATDTGVRASGVQVPDEAIDAVLKARAEKDPDLRVKWNLDPIAYQQDWDAEALASRTNAARRNITSRKEFDPRAEAVEQQNRKDKHEEIPRLIKALREGKFRDEERKEAEEIVARRRARGLGDLGALESLFPKPGLTGQEKRLYELGQKAASPAAESDLSPEEKKEFEETIRKRQEAGLETFGFENYIGGAE